MGEADGHEAGHEAGAAERGWLGLPGPVRWILRYALMGVVSLLLGRVVELVAEQVKHNTEAVTESFAHAETDALASVGRLRPTALARLYLTALRPAPSPLLAQDRRMMDGAEAIARVRAHIAASRGGPDAAETLGAAQALMDSHRSPLIAPPGAVAPSGSLRARVDALPEPGGVAAARGSLALGPSASRPPSELAKILQDAPGAAGPVNPFSEHLPPLGGATASPAAPSPPAVAPAAGAAVSAPPTPHGAPALDRPSRPPPTPDNPEAGPSAEEQALGVQLHHWAGRGSGNWLSPVTALADVMWTLATRGAWAGRIVMLLQLVLGALCAAPLIAWLGDDKRGGGVAGPIWLVGGPFVAVAFGSLVSLSVWALMEGAHRVFGGFTHIPGLSLGLGTAGFCCWHVGWRATELALGHPVERLIERV